METEEHMNLYLKMGMILEIEHQILGGIHSKLALL